MTGIVLTGATGPFELGADTAALPRADRPHMNLGGVVVARVGIVVFAMAAHRTAPGARPEPYRPTW